MRGGWSIQCESERHTVTLASCAYQKYTPRACVQPTPPDLDEHGSDPRRGVLQQRIKACARAIPARVDPAFTLINDMVGSGTWPDLITCNTVLNACVEVLQIQETWAGCAVQAHRTLART